MQSPVEKLLDISQLCDIRLPEDNYEMKISLVKTYLRSYLNLPELNVNSSTESDGRFVLETTIDNEAELLAKLRVIQNFIEFRIIRNEDGNKLLINRIDPKILDKSLGAKTKDLADTILTEKLSRLTIESSLESNVPSNPPSSSLPSIDVPPQGPKRFFSPSQPCVDKKLFSKPKEFFAALQTFDNVQLATVSNKVSKDLRKNMQAALILMYELIARGAHEQLKNLLQTKCSSEIKVTKVTHDKRVKLPEMLDSLELHSKSTETTQQTSTIYTINFNFSDLVDHINKKKEFYNSNTAFLGFREDVENCMKLVDANNARMCLILVQLDRINAFRSIDNVFSLT